MAESALRSQAEQLFAGGAASTAGRPALARLHDELVSSLARFSAPMRVVVVGRIKVGKSTMVNALLGERLVATGRQELTFNVNWLRHGSPHRLVVHFKDGRPPEQRTLEELETLTRRAEEHKELLAGIAHIEVFYDNDLLRTFDIVDTPGLGSAFRTDSQNTLRFLGLRAADVDQSTVAEARGADAIVYLFSRSLHEHDDRVVDDFHGDAVGELTPINAIAVLTRTEQNWDPDAADRDPMADGRRIARRLTDDPRARRVFFTILPVATHVGLGAQLIDARDVAALHELAALRDDELDTQLAGEVRFARVGDRDQRERLLDALGLYGIWLATRLIRGGCTTHEQLTAELLRASGVEQLRELLVSHFGQRAFVIKLDTALRRALTACQQLRPDTRGDDRAVLAAVARQLERMRAEEPVFRRLRVLCDYYDGTLDLTDDEVSDLLRVTGEHGASLAHRLGVAVPGGNVLDAAVERVEERLRHWRRRATGGGNGTMLAAADEVSLAYLELADRLRTAQELLNGG